MAKIAIFSPAPCGRPEYRTAVDRYLTMLSPWISLEEVHYGEASVAAGSGEEAVRRALLREAEAVRQRLKPGDQAVLLSEHARCFTTLALREQVDKWLGCRGRLCFILGGAHGLHPELSRDYPQALSLSPLTLPHELALVVLAEQLYRVSAIAHGKRYHY